MRRRPSERLMLKQRPVYLDLVRIRLPLPGIVSILHRASGALLFLIGIPLLLGGLAASLESPESYAELKAAFAHPLAKLVLIGFLWAYLHHFFAGIRFLLLDLLQGIELASARRSSVAVLAVSLALTLIIGARLW
jgi:succinate dehydrogenase / fumarate reductase cytochrome b subunit